MTWNHLLPQFVCSSYEILPINYTVCDLCLGFVDCRSEESCSKLLPSPWSWRSSAGLQRQLPDVYDIELRGASVDRSPAHQQPRWFCFAGSHRHGGQRPTAANGHTLRWHTSTSGSHGNPYGCHHFISLVVECITNLCNTVSGETKKIHSLG